MARNLDLLLQRTANSIISNLSKEKVGNDITHEGLLYEVNCGLDKIRRVVKFYDDVINGRWVKCSEVLPEDFGLDWVLVQFVEKKTDFIGLPYIAEFIKEKKEWHIQGGDATDSNYINNDCVASSWKIIEKSPEHYFIN